MLKFLIVCPLVFLAGFIDAIAGGGGLISLPAYIFTGMPMTNCLATNKMSSCMGTTLTTIKYARSGFIPYLHALFCVPCAFLGSNIGANIALRVDDRLFKMIMLVVLPLTALYVLTKKDFKPSGKPLSKKLTIAICMLVAFVIGMYDGFYGPGTGTFLILLLGAIAKLDLQKANGLTKALNFTSNISALAVYLINAQVVFPLGIAAGCFSLAGNYLGARQFTSGGEKIVKPVILIVLIIFIIKVVSELFF
ncbi:MAG: TSUP family transporter [Clostridia bacterium]|nr:TSUP family transporter [Clostridia bacterium]